MLVTESGFAALGRGGLGISLRAPLQVSHPGPGPRLALSDGGGPRAGSKPTVTADSRLGAAIPWRARTPRFPSGGPRPAPSCRQRLQRDSPPGPAAGSLPVSDSEVTVARSSTKCPLMNKSPNFEVDDTSPSVRALGPGRGPRRSPLEVASYVRLSLPLSGRCQ
jgi:hypothetical protein